MLLALFLIGGVVLTSVSLTKKDPLSALFSLFLWVMAGFASLSMSELTWDLYYAAFFGFIFLGIAMGIYSAVEFAADADKGGDIFEEGGKRKRKATSPATVAIFKNEHVDFSTDYQSMLGEVSAMRGELRGGVKRTKGWSAPASKKSTKVVKFW